MNRSMDKKDLKIVFMGTPEFAETSLRKLVDDGYNIVGVVTMPDKPAGRGHKLQASPVKKLADSKGLKLMQPEKLKDPTFINELKSLDADLQIVVAFRMLPEIVWAMPPKGTFNLHASLLPQYRGAAPINWAIINGEKRTGVTTFFIKHEIDTGEIISQREIDINDGDDFGSIYYKLAEIGASLVTETVDMIIQGKAEPKPQEDFNIEGELNTAPKIFKETCKINWEMPANRIHNLIRGVSPVPAAWTELHETEKDPVAVKILKSRVEASTHNHQCGSIVTDNKHFLKVAAEDGYVEIIEMQFPGKKRMPVEELLKGRKFSAEAHFI